MTAWESGCGNHKDCNQFLFEFLCPEYFLCPEKSLTFINFFNFFGDFFTLQNSRNSCNGWDVLHERDH